MGISLLVSVCLVCLFGVQKKRSSESCFLENGVGKTSASVSAIVMYGLCWDG